MCSRRRKKVFPCTLAIPPIEDADVPYIGIDNEKLGYELGEQLAKALDHKGKIGVIAGDFKQAGHRMRVAGFEKYMEKKNPGSPLNGAKRLQQYAGFSERCG